MPDEEYVRVLIKAGLSRHKALIYADNLKKAMEEKDKTKKVIESKDIMEPKKMFDDVTEV